MSRISGASVVSEVRLNSSRLKGDARQAEGVLKKLTRQFASSSGTDPFINAIARFGPAAAGALATTKLLTTAFQGANAAADMYYAKQSGNLERQIKAQEGLREMLENVPIAGPLGAGIRGLFDAKIRDEIENTKEATKQQEKRNESRQKQIDLAKEARDEAEKIIRTTGREIAMLNKSPRMREIMEAQQALEDYRREAEKVAQKSGRGLSGEQLEAIGALEKKVEAMKKRRGPAEQGDIVDAAKRAQMSILEVEIKGGAAVVAQARKNSEDKKKAQQEVERRTTDQVKAEAAKRASELEQKVRQLDPELRSPKGREMYAEMMRQRKIARAGTVTEAGTRDMNKRQGQALSKRQSEAQRLLRERQEREMEDLKKTGVGLPESSRNKVMNPLIKELQEKQKRERKDLSEQQIRERNRFEEDTSKRRRLREPGRAREEEQRSRPADELKMRFRDGLQKWLGITPTPSTGPGPREGDEKVAKDLQDAAKALKDAADAQKKAPKVGVIRR
jgi:hypothetical protein